ncbi:MAG: hypothetical protein BYD32DRAFT_404628 [Podila humilis]|nr:MAG: hypothetical protein BYD32DRAFT_404628 [Podila humilis]
MELRPILLVYSASLLAKSCSSLSDIKRRRGVRLSSRGSSAINTDARHLLDTPLSKRTQCPLHHLTQLCKHTN